VSSAANHADFNRDFFTAVSAIIPLLFLALVIDSKGYENLLKGPLVLRQWARGKGVAIGLFSGWIAGLLVYGPLLIIIAGAWGEFLAIYALYQGQAGQTTQQIVLFSAAFLIVVVASGPAWAYMRSFREFLIPRRAARKAAPAETPRQVAKQPDPAQGGLVAPGDDTTDGASRSGG
jgi:hypothetical protein